MTAATALELTVSGLLRTSGTNYTINFTGGELTFLSAPTNNALILARKYYYFAFEDEALSGMLSDESNNVDLAAARLLESVAASEKHFFNYVQGAIKVDKAKVIENLLAQAKHLREVGYQSLDRDMQVTHVDLAELTGSEYEDYEDTLENLETDE